MTTESERRSMLCAVFDALPSPVFVVDQDVRIHEYNAAASELLMTDRNSVLKRRAGEILHCLHSTEEREECGGAPFCANCIIRNSVTEAFQGHRVVRNRTRIEIIRDGNKIEMYALISASPFVFHDSPLVLLVIEDISEIAELYHMVPICSECGKVRHENETWMQVESYFKINWDLDFSHGFCPDCYKAHMNKLNSFVNAKPAPPEKTDKPHN